MPDIVEIHVPLIPTEGLPPEEYQFPWIDQIEELLSELESEGAVAVYDDGEQYGDVYIFFITGADEPGLLAAASRVATLEGAPAGAFAMVTSEDAPEFGLGRRVALPVH